jgi:hypothetical protein
MTATQAIPEWRAAADEIWAVLRETDRIVKDSAQQINQLGRRFGEMVEYMVIPNLLTKFNDCGLPFTKAYPDTKIADPEHDIYAEVDAFLENGDSVMIVETKNNPSTYDVDEHIERMEKLRRYADLHQDTRKYLGAVAGLVFADSVKNYALKKGFYVIEPSGDTFNIIKPEGKYHPHEW